MTPAPWDRASLLVVAGLCALKAVVHVLLVSRYGYHGDELYFIECARHLAWGYVDHPPLIPWIARVADELGGGLVTLRMPAIAAGTGTMLGTALLVREWGGGWRAQLLALLSLLVAPAHLRMATMLDIPVVEVFLCTVAAYLVARALARGERWTWVLAGGVLGLAVLAKHSSLLWGASLAAGLVVMGGRKAWASPWPWLGAIVALTMTAPNLVWQAQHGFATLEFARNLRRELLVQQGRALFVAAQLLYFHPLTAPVWLMGLMSLLRAPGQAQTSEPGESIARASNFPLQTSVPGSFPAAPRPFAVLFLVMFSVLWFAGGKPYYLASAYPPVLAAGGVALERWFAARVAGRRVFVALLATTGAALGLLSLPALPLPRVDSAFDWLFGWAVPPLALTHDLHGMYGWDEHAAAVDRVYLSLPAHDRERASVLTASYSQAGALNVLREQPVPRAVSGHMTYYFWGPDEHRGAVLIAYGIPREFLERHYRTCAEQARIDPPLARPSDRNLPVYVCREPNATMAELWPELKRFGHRRPSSAAGSQAARPGG